MAKQPVPAELAQRRVALVADDWCPQHCESDPNRKGYIVDIVSGALDEEGIPHTIVHRPLTRALRMTEQGTFDGLLTPTVARYAQFQFHREAVGYQQYCFYVNADSPWTYSTPKDLLGKRVGYLTESGFGNLESFMIERLVVGERERVGQQPPRLVRAAALQLLVEGADHRLDQDQTRAPRPAAAAAVV